jgi:hypothetical protein
MKQVFICLVMIFSLLLAICGCSNDFTLQLEPNLEVPEKPVIIQKEPGKNKPEPSYEGEPEETDLEDIDLEEADDDDIDYLNIEQEETDDYEPDITEIVPPEFVDFNLLSKKEIRFNFTTAVNNIFCAFTPHQEIESIQDGKTVKINLKESLELQTEFLIELNVKDAWDNSLSVEVPLFVNDWIPKIEINELRTEYSKDASRAEFVEFKVKSAGNLGGLRLYIMYNSKKPFVFDFPPVDVKQGEYITLHLRTLENSCINELGENLSESEGTDSSPIARDLWISGSLKLLHKTDIVYLQDANGRILDAVILNEEPGETWKKNQSHFTEIIENLYNSGAWKSEDGNLPGPFDTIDTSTIKSSATKSISRYENKENTHTAKDWHITNTGGVSPGLPNK